MARISDLVIRYLDRDAGSSGGAPGQYTCSAGTIRTAVSAALSGKSPANLSGGLVRWDVGSNATAHKWSAIYSYDNASTTLTFDSDLPNVVVNTDKFTLLTGGKWLTNTRIPGLIVNNYVYNPTNLTGVTVDYCAMLNGAGNGTIAFTASNGQASWTPPGGVAGPGVAITGVSAAILIGGGVSVEEKSKFLSLTVTGASLPVINTTDTLALTIPKGVHVNPFTGSETLNGITIYRPVGIINTNATDTIYNVRAYAPNPFTGAAQSTVKSGTSIGVGADTLQVTNATNWPVHGWIAKVDTSGVVLDCRYCYDKTGNNYTVMSPAGGMRGYSAVVWNSLDNIVPMPWQDIGLDAPSTSQFEDPASEQTPPAGITFSAPMSVDNALFANDLAPSAIYCIWERFVIPANMRPASNLIADLRIYAEVDQE